MLDVQLYIHKNQCFIYYTFNCQVMLWLTYMNLCVMNMPVNGIKW
jgi:hypothetical protein